MKQFLKRRYLPLTLLLFFAVTLLISSRSNTDYPLLNSYLELILIYIGINIILAVSLNLVNGYMGEFSVGHAGFMAIGAYASAVLTVQYIPREMGPLFFPLALLIGGAVAGVAGLLLAFPSFRTRGDYLAIITLAFNMIVRNGIENIEALGGPRGYLGIDKLTTLSWIFVFVVGAIYLARNFVYSNFGRGVLAIREDETAAGLVGVNTQQVKVLTFVFSAFLAGIAGGLFAHTLQFINPKSFTIIKSTEMLVMVYLGGVSSLGGSILGATIFTVVMEGLRSLLEWVKIGAEWRQVVMPLLLILLMLFRPRGIMGMREFPFLVPLKERIMRHKGKLDRSGEELP